MWLGYKEVMALLECGQNSAYNTITTLQKELMEKGFLINPNKKVPVAYFCERYGLNEEYVLSKIDKKEVIV